MSSQDKFPRVAGMLLSALAIALLPGLGTLNAEPPAVAESLASEVQARFVQGCVDCHDGTVQPTVGAMLERMGHDNVDDDTAQVPGDCSACHSEAGGMWFLSEVSHMAHYRDPENSAFVQEFGGDCRHCHALDAETGAVSVKSGAKNW